MTDHTQHPGTTSRLVLRVPTLHECEQIASLWTDPDVTHHIGGPRDRTTILKYFREYAEEPGRFLEEDGDRWWSVFDRTSGQFKGVCSLLAKEVEGQNEIELGYFFLPAFWGKGFATEASQWVRDFAFNQLGLETLIAIVTPTNLSSIAVAKKVGMKLEKEVLRSDGVKRQIYRVDNHRGKADHHQST